MIKIDPTSLLPASWKKINDAFKEIDKTIADVQEKIKLSPYELHLVMSCLEYKLHSIEVTGYFRNELDHFIEHVSSQQTEDKKPEDIYK